MNTTISLISLSNELNGLIDLFQRLFSLAEKGSNRFARRRAGEAARTLHGLHFTPAGFRRPLENIVSGTSSAADVEALASFYTETSPAVVEGVQALGIYIDVVRKQCGAGASAKLEELLHGPDGKFVIRYEIEGLVAMIRGGRSAASDVQEQAEKILGMITEFNAKLVDLHDTIFPPTGVPT